MGIRQREGVGTPSASPRRNSGESIPSFARREATFECLVRLIPDRFMLTSYEIRSGSRSAPDSADSLTVASVKLFWLAHNQESGSGDVGSYDDVLSYDSSTVTIQLVAIRY